MDNQIETQRGAQIEVPKYPTNAKEGMQNLDLEAKIEQVNRYLVEIILKLKELHPGENICDIVVANLGRTLTNLTSRDEKITVLPVSCALPREDDIYTREDATHTALAFLIKNDNGSERLIIFDPTYGFYSPVHFSQIHTERVNSPRLTNAENPFLAIEIPRSSRKIPDYNGQYPYIALRIGNSPIRLKNGLNLPRKDKTSSSSDNNDNLSRLLIESSIKMARNKYEEENIEQQGMDFEDYLECSLGISIDDKSSLNEQTLSSFLSSSLPFNNQMKRFWNGDPVNNEILHARWNVLTGDIRNKINTVGELVAALILNI